MRIFRTFLAVFAIFALFFGFSAFSVQAEPVFSPKSAPYSLDVRGFSQLPLLHEGRIKPIDTFARMWLTNLSGKEKLGGKPARYWLALALFSPQEMYQIPLISIPNPQVSDALQLVENKAHLYTMADVFYRLRTHKKLLETIANTPQENREVWQQHLADIYQKTYWLFDITRSISLILPIFYVDDEALAKALNVPIHSRLNYQQIYPKKGLLQTFLEGFPAQNLALSRAEKQGLLLVKLLQTIERDKNTVGLNIMPPYWDNTGEEWQSPWRMLQAGEGSPEGKMYLESWHKMAVAWQKKDADLWQKAVENTQNLSAEYVNKSVLSAEVFYHNINFFRLSLWAYLITFLGVVLGGIFRTKRFFSASLFVLGFGLILHGFGIVMRMVILSRPPVATLYESVLFVGLVLVGFAFFMALKRRDFISLTMGSLGGALLHFIAMRYAEGGDSMGLLMAVLNTNFWLATHVVTITFGYGICLVAALFAHVYLGVRAVPKWALKIPPEPLLNTSLAMGLMALLATTLGTILGGIWADQSWGRFWGWDPKENGALLIVLWLIFMIHGRMSKVFSPLMFMAGMALLNVTVAVAWFGVNFLGVGLHSYGFAPAAMWFLLAFCVGEFLLVSALVWRIRTQKKEAKNL